MGYLWGFRMKQKQLLDMWQSIQPACEELLKHASVAGKKLTFDDFLWAYSVFWYILFGSGIICDCLCTFESGLLQLCSPF